MSFANIPSVLDLSYLSISPRSWGVSAMGNLVEGDSEADSYVHAVRAVLVTWAPAVIGQNGQLAIRQDTAMR